MIKKRKPTAGQLWAAKKFDWRSAETKDLLAEGYDAAIRKVAKARRDERAKCVDAVNGVRNEYVGRYDKLPAVVACDDIITMLEKLP